MDIGAWWAALTGLQQVFAVAAIPATVILILQTVLTLLGMSGGADVETDDGGADFDGDGSCDADHTFGDETAADDIGDADGLRLLTVRSIIAFFAVGGWFGVVLVDVGVHDVVAVIGALLAGFVAALLIALFFKWISKLQANGNMDVKCAIGKRATVYLTIPAAGTSTGKINLELQDRYVELEAKTKQAQAIPTGSTVRVVDVIDGGTLLVEVAEET